MFCIIDLFYILNIVIYSRSLVKEVASFFSIFTQIFLFVFLFGKNLWEIWTIQVICTKTWLYSCTFLNFQNLKIVMNCHGTIWIIWIVWNVWSFGYFNIWIVWIFKFILLHWSWNILTFSAFSMLIFKEVCGILDLNNNGFHKNGII